MRLFFSFVGDSTTWWR